MPMESPLGLAFLFTTLAAAVYMMADHAQQDPLVTAQEIDRWEQIRWATLVVCALVAGLAVSVAVKG